MTGASGGFAIKSTDRRTKGFLHDGRTSDLKAAILAHKSSGSEAYAVSVIGNFQTLSTQEQQDLLNFRRSL